MYTRKAGTGFAEIQYKFQGGRKMNEKEMREYVDEIFTKGEYRDIFMKFTNFEKIIKKKKLKKKKGKQAMFVRKAAFFKDLMFWTNLYIRQNTKFSNYKIAKTIELTEKEYEIFTNCILDYYDWVKEHKKIMGVDEDGTWHCLLIKAENGTSGILVQASGFDYARYTAYLENIDE